MKGLYCCILSFLTFTAFGQTDGDYRSRQTGNWNSVTTWQVFNAAAWHNLEDAGAGVFHNITPTNISGIITIMDLMTVTVTADVTVDQIEYENNPFTGNTGTLSINSGATLTVNNGLGDDIRLLNDFTSLATLEVNGTLFLSTGATIVDDDYGNLGSGRAPVTSDTYKVKNGGIHIHTTGSGVDRVPFADWQLGSTCQINATVAGVPLIDSAIPFHHFIWNGSGQTAALNLAGTLRSVNGDFTVTSTNGNVFQLSTTTAYTLTVGGNFSIQGDSRVQFTSSGNPVVHNITGNLSISSTSLATNAIQFNATGNVDVNITGDFSKSDVSTLNLCAGSTGTTTLDLTGNFSLTGGTLTRGSTVSSGGAAVSFIGFNIKTFTNSSTISNAINFSIANGKTLDLGTSAMTGTGTFLLNAGGTLRIGSGDGLNKSSTNLGNLRLTGTRTYTANGNIIYNGTVAQNLGDEWGTGGGLDGVAVNLEIVNTSSAGVTNNIIGNTSLVGNLTLTTGSLNIGNSNTLEIQSNFIRTGGTIGGDATSNLSFSGSGTLNTLVFTTGMEFVNNLTVSRATELVLGSNATVSGAINLSGGNLNFSGRTLTMNGGSISTNGTGLRSSSSSNLILGGSTFTGAIPFSGAGNQLNTVTFGTNGGTYTWTSPVIVNDSVKLTLGALTHNSGLTMANNSDFVKGGGTIGGVALVVSGSDRFNLTYTGAGNTGVELPTSDSDALNNLIVSSSGTVTLTTAVKVNGDLSLTGGTFDSNLNPIEIVGDLVANSTSDLVGTVVTFSGPSSEISGSNVLFDDLTVTGTVAVNVGGAGWRINGDLVNNGSLSVTSGAIRFGGTTTITGSGICNFRTVRLAGTLTAPTQMNVGVAFIYESGTFNANNGTVNFTGSPSTTLSNVASVTFHNILITGGLTSSSAELNLTGNFTDNGSFDRNGGTVRFVGTSPQLIEGTSLTEFNNITITNAAGPPAVQVTSNKDLRGVLTLSAGTRFDPDGATGNVVFRLRSTSDVFVNGVTNDAAIAALPTGAVVDGNVTIERYMALEGGSNNNNRIYRYISSPIQNAAVSQLTDNFKISGTFTGSNQVGSQSMFGYNENVIVDQNGNGLDINDGYYDFPSDNVTETMDNGRGYAIFVYGNESPYTTNGNALWDIRGTINSGEVIFNDYATLTTSSNTSSDGWNLVGNPYPSTIDWDAASGWTKQGLANAIYMRDNGLSTPGYATYINGAGTNGGTRYIPIGQAFQVRATSTPIDFRANEAVKVAGQQATYFREIPQQLVRVTLASASARDEMIVRFTDAATDGFDPDWDAYKLANYKLNLSSMTGTDEKFAINSLPGLTCGKTVKLSMTEVAVGTYSLNFSEFESISAEMGIQLFDAYKSTTINVREETYYSFEVTEDVNSFGDNRFELRFIGIEVPDFNAFADDICASSQAVVNISDSEQGVRYRIMKNGSSLTEWQSGTGADLAFQLQTAQLSTGENVLSIQASTADCEAVYIEKPLELNVVPLTDVEKVDNGSNCGAGKVTLVASGGVDGNYKWYETELDQEAIAGAVNSTFVTPDLNKTKTFYVATINDLGCESARKPVVATIVMFDNVSIAINEDSNTLTSSYPDGNQWFLNGVMIPGATSQWIEATETGLYEVEVSLSSCSTRASQEMIVLGSEGGSTNGIRFYPNPVADVLYIELPDLRPAKGEISNSAGQPLGTMDFESGKAEFSFSGRAPGLYLVKVTQNKKVVHYKIIKK